MNTQLMTRRVRHKVWMEQYVSQQESGLSIREWCEANGIIPSTFYRRLRILREEAMGQLDSGIDKQNLSGDANETVSMANFVEVRFPQQQPTCSGIIVRTGSAEISILPDASAEHIKTVLEVLTHA